MLLVGVSKEAGAVIQQDEDDLVFDYLEYAYGQWWPAHVESVRQGEYHYRLYPNGDYLLEWDGDLWYTINNGPWQKNGSSMQVWYDWIKDTKIDSEVTIAGVPFQSQLSAACSPNYLCGYAGANMLTAFHHGVTPTTWFMQQMALEAKGSTCPASLSNPLDFVEGMQTVGNVPDAYYGYLSYDSIKMLVSEGYPVHVSLDYGELGGHRCTASWNDGHVLVIVGYSELSGTWTVHDPLCASSPSGAYREIPSVAFRNAIEEISPDDTGAWSVVAI